LDPEGLAAKLTPRTKAIIPVQLFGHPCAMDQVMAVANAHGLRVIEDCAQAIGARFKNGPVGSFGDAAALSFYPTKNLGGYGDGGMVLTKDAKLAERVRRLRTHGSHGRYHHTDLGTNSRLDELQAAILRVKLRHLEVWNEARRRNAAHYEAAFRRHQLLKVILPRTMPGCTHVYHLYTIRTPRRDRIKEVLMAHGIATEVYYPSTLPAQPALSGLYRSTEQFPRAEEACKTALSLPLYPELPAETIDQVVDHLAQALLQA
jgi:dTDP-4-amino-4,6-dideoxygalactose transaminase